MEASAGLVAGSHIRNELVVIHGHEEVNYIHLKTMTILLLTKIFTIFMQVIGL